MVAAFSRGSAWKVPALGLGIVGLGLMVIPRPTLPDAVSSLPSPSASVPVASGSLEMRGLAADLVDQEKPSGDGELAWWTTWRLCWDPVPGASDYLVTTVSFEGAGRPQSVAGTCHELGVANGTTGESGTYPGRSEQLIQVEVSMSVSVAARLPDGTVGPASTDIPVGEEYP